MLLRVKLLMEDLLSLAGTIEELQAGCPSRGCGAGEDAAVGALWRRWMTSRRHVGLLVAHTQQKGEEWKDIAACVSCARPECLCSLLLFIAHEDSVLFFSWSSVAASWPGFRPRRWTPPV